MEPDMSKLLIDQQDLATVIASSLQTQLATRGYCLASRNVGSPELIRVGDYRDLREVLADIGNNAATAAYAYAVEVDPHCKLADDDPSAFIEEIRNAWKHRYD
jgi:hypothetical protein